jgi:hypothetical protein
MQSSYEANLFLAGTTVEVRPRRGFRRTRALPLADPGRGVGRQLIPRGAQRLQGLL